MSVDTVRQGRSVLARRAGALYAAYILVTVFASLVGYIGLSDAAALQTALESGGPMFRVGLVAALASGLLFVVTAWALYALLREVDQPLALLLLVLNAVGVAVQCASYLFLVMALSAGDVPGLVAASVLTYRTAFIIAQLFFSTWLFPLGWLVLRSGFLPVWLGWLLIVDGVADFVWFLQGVLLPDVPAISYPSWVIGFVAEVGLTLWLLLRGASRALR